MKRLFIRQNRLRLWENLCCTVRVTAGFFDKPQSIVHTASTEGRG